MKVEWEHPESMNVALQVFDWEASAYFCSWALANPEEIEPPAVEPGELKTYA